MKVCQYPYLLSTYKPYNILNGKDVQTKHFSANRGEQNHALLKKRSRRGKVSIFWLRKYVKRNKYMKQVTK